MDDYSDDEFFPKLNTKLDNIPETLRSFSSKKSIQKYDEKERNSNNLFNL